jgi:hypothetical protein
MTKRNPENERIKRRYLLYLKDAKGRDKASVDAAASAMHLVILKTADGLCPYLAPHTGFFEGFACCRSRWSQTLDRPALW